MKPESLTRKELRQRIDALEALDSVIGALDDVACHEYAEGDRQDFHLQIMTGGKQEIVAFACNINRETIITGLQNMRDTLKEQV